jgi:hypothetical protein
MGGRSIEVVPKKRSILLQRCSCKFKSRSIGSCDGELQRQRCKILEHSEYPSAFLKQATVLSTYKKLQPSTTLALLVAINSEIVGLAPGKNLDG